MPAATTTTTPAGSVTDEPAFLAPLVVGGLAGGLGGHGGVGRPRQEGLPQLVVDKQSNVRFRRILLHINISTDT